MKRKLAFLHTSHVLIPTFASLAQDLLPETEIFHMTDESLIRNTISAQRLTAATTRRLAAMIGSAHKGGAGAVMVTCSSIGPAVDVARSLYDFPIFRIDEAMADKAVSVGKRIGVAATLRTRVMGSSSKPPSAYKQPALTRRRSLGPVFRFGSASIHWAPLSEEKSS